MMQVGIQPLLKALSLFVMAAAGALAVFLTMQAAPGDPALVVLGEHASPDAVAAYRKEHHLDDPVLLQFARWGKGVLQGDFGKSLSIAKGKDVTSLIVKRLPNTLFIAAYAMILALLFSLVAGSLAALNRGSNIDLAAT